MVIMMKVEIPFNKKKKKNKKKNNNTIPSTLKDS